MKLGIFQRIRKALGQEPKLHPVEQKLAKRWIKQRMVTVFPALRNNPDALEKAYHGLSLEPRPGQEEGDADTVFVLIAPEAS